jgi:hypothetical protein
LVDHVRRVEAELCDRATEMVEHVHALDCVSQNSVAQPQRIAEDTTQLLTSAAAIVCDQFRRPPSSRDERGTLVPGGRLPDNRN